MQVKEGDRVMNAEEVIEKLDLRPLPDEGGFYRQTWLSIHSSAIYYLLTPENNGFSALHKLSELEIYHFYAGDPVELVLFPPADSTEDVKTLILGNRIEMEEVPQFAVPAGTTQGSRLKDGGKWALLGTTMAPPYSQKVFQLSSRNTLLELFPEYRDLILQFTREEVS